MYNTLRLFLNPFKLNTNNFTRIKVFKYVYKDTKLLKMQSALKVGLN